MEKLRKVLGKLLLLISMFILEVSNKLIVPDKKSKLRDRVVEILTQMLETPEYVDQRFQRRGINPDRGAFRRSDEPKIECENNLNKGLKKLNY